MSYQIDGIFLMRPSVVLGQIEKHNHQNDTNFGGSQFEFVSNLYIYIFDKNN